MSATDAEGRIEGEALVVEARVEGQALAHGGEGGGAG